MKFFAEVDGIIWECNSVGEYFGTVIACFLGKLTAWAVIIGTPILALMLFRACG